MDFACNSSSLYTFFQECPRLCIPDDRKTSANLGSGFVSGHDFTGCGKMHGFSSATLPVIVSARVSALPVDPARTLAPTANSVIRERALQVVPFHEVFAKLS